VTPQVEAYLHTQIEMLRQLVQARSGVTDGFLHVGGALAGLRTAGALTEAEAREWAQVVNDEMGRFPDRTHPGIRPMHPDGVFGGQRSFIYKAGTPPPQSFAQPAIPRFLRLIPGPDDQIPVRGGRIAPGLDRNRVMDEVRLTDDTGVEYTLELPSTVGELRRAR
jgi:hypothetical protein